MTSDQGDTLISLVQQLVALTQWLQLATQWLFVGECVLAFMMTVIAFRRR